MLKGEELAAAIRRAIELKDQKSPPAACGLFHALAALLQKR